MQRSSSTHFLCWFCDSPPGSSPARIAAFTHKVSLGRAALASAGFAFFVAASSASGCFVLPSRAPCMGVLETMPQSGLCEISFDWQVRTRESGAMDDQTLLMARTGVQDPRNNTKTTHPCQRVGFSPELAPI